MAEKRLIARPEKERMQPRLILKASGFCYTGYFVLAGAFYLVEQHDRIGCDDEEDGIMA
jgi:hypothetical protein